VVDVPLGVGDAQGSGVHGLSALRKVLENTRAALEAAKGPVITVGGDCGVELAALPHALRRSGGSTAVIWLDAHPDLNTPDSSPTGAFHGMVLRTLLGEGSSVLVPETVLPATELVLAGTRALDDAESDFLDTSGIRTLTPQDLSVDSLLGALEATGAGSVYLHVDLDVLDPGSFVSLSHPEPFGLAPGFLIELIHAVKQRFEFAGASVTEFAPASPEQVQDDLPTILRIIGALASENEHSE
jgi:arginase